jgi:hypothetical protein
MLGTPDQISESLKEILLMALEKSNIIIEKMYYGKDPRGKVL